jgi:hypothetical protein
MVDAVSLAGGRPASTGAARQSHVRMVSISAPKRSSMDCPLEGRGASWAFSGGSASVTLRVPFVVTSTCPNRSFTGHSRRSRDR